MLMGMNGIRVLAPYYLDSWACLGQIEDVLKDFKIGAQSITANIRISHSGSKAQLPDHCRKGVTKGGALQKPPILYLVYNLKPSPYRPNIAHP